MNNPLKAQYELLAERTGELSFRERLILAAAGAVIILALVDQLIMQPLIKKKLSFENQHSQAQDAATLLEEKIADLENQLRNHPSRVAESKIKDLTLLNSRVDSKIHDITGNLISPEEMPFVLGELLSESSGLSIESVVSKPAEKLLVADEKQQQSATLYRHDLELTLVGSFFAVTKYLEAAESLPSKLIWDQLDYTVLEHPTGRLSLKVHTLSSGEDLIRVAR